MFNSVAVTVETATFPLLSVTIATEAVKVSVSIVEPDPERLTEGTPQSPAPSPSEVQTSPMAPAVVIPFSTLLADNVPSAKSAKFAL